MDVHKQQSSSVVLGAFFITLALLGLCSAPALGQFDFTAQVWSGAHGLQSYTVGRVTVDCNPYGGNTYTLFWNPIDGLGVTSGNDWEYEPDEIEDYEPFHVTIAGGMYIHGIMVADLYPKFGSTSSEWYDWNGHGDGSGEATGETGYVYPDGGSRITFVGDDSDEANGEQYVPLGMVVTTLEFTSICSNSDYSVMSLDPYENVCIDIKPGSYPNSINLKSKGVVPVAILTSDSFDATTVDPVNVLFACAAPVKWAVEDVDGDSDQDMILHFKTQELTLTAQSIAASLTGETLDGVYLIKGMDTVKIVGVKGVKCLPPAPAPGTGTPGYWKNHPEAWPVSCLCVGGTFYWKEDAIAVMCRPVRGDKRLTLFPALVAAKLNVEMGNDSSCIEGVICAADGWMSEHPLCEAERVRASSQAWKEAECLYLALDAYNNGELCAPSRDELESE